MTIIKTFGFEDKNAADYDEYTDRLMDGLDQIRKDSSLKATITQLSQITNIHRNTITDRRWPSQKLKTIKEERIKREKKEKEVKPERTETVLQERLDNALNELVYWYKKHKTLLDSNTQLQHNLKMMTDSKNKYQEDAKRYKEECERLHNKLEILMKE